MPKPYSLDLREPVFGYADEGHSCPRGCGAFGGIGFLCRQPGEGLFVCGKPSAKPSGGKAKLDAGVSLGGRPTEKADITMPELAAELAATCEKADTASLSRWLIRIGYRFKKTLQGQRA